MFTSSTVFQAVGHAFPRKAEFDPECLRDMAFGIEEVLASDRSGVSFEGPAARYLKRALFDLAERIDRDT